jgi:DNA ligase-1
MMTPLPMLASPADLTKLRYPVLVSPKIDGVRCLIDGGVALSRSLKSIPNRAIQRWVQDHAETLQGLDGELVVGRVNHPDVYRTTVSGVMSEDGAPDFRFLVFDAWDRPGVPYEARFRLGCIPAARLSRVSPVYYVIATTEGQVLREERDWLAQGYEGVMLRDPRGDYKHGRASVKNGALLKLKRHEDHEATVVGWTELMTNENPTFTNELGRTARSSHQANLRPSGLLGTLVVIGQNGPWAGVEFEVGTGFTEAERTYLWEARGTLKGLTVKYKHTPHGAKDKPRHPVFLGFRSPLDAS